MAGFNGIMKKWIKPAIKATTHVLTIGGIVLVVSPAARGVNALAHGDLTAAKDHILYDTVGTGTVSGSTDLFEVLVDFRAGRQP